MTTTELAQFVTRHLQVSDLGAVEAERAIDIIDAINFALQTFFAEAPKTYSRTTLSHRVKTPDALSLPVTHGLNEIGYDAFLSTQRGCTVVIAGDEIFNEVTGPALLLHDYQGETGEKSATLWYDSIPVLDFLIQRITSEPIVQETDTRLLRDNDTRGLTTRSRYRSQRYSSATDYPTHYALEHIGGSLDAELDAAFQLRLLPRPTLACTIKMEADILPIRYGLDALSTPARIPVPDSLCSRLLVPLVEGRLTSSPLWSDTSDRALALDRQDRALQGVRELPPFFARPRNQLRTKRGW